MSIGDISTYAPTSLQFVLTAAVLKGTQEQGCKDLRFTNKLGFNFYWELIIYNHVFIVMNLNTMIDSNDVTATSL